MTSSWCSTTPSLVSCLRPFWRRANHPTAACVLPVAAGLILVVGVVDVGGGGGGVGGLPAATEQKGGGGVSADVLYIEGGVGHEDVLESDACLALVLSLFCSLVSLRSCRLLSCMNRLSPSSVSGERHSLAVQPSSLNLATMI